MMSYHELTRKELQTLCKQNGLPANKSNVVMASSLTSFFSDQQTITQACGEFLTPSTAAKSVRNRAVPKPERLETSLASLILGTPKPPVKGGQDALLKKCKEPRAGDVTDSTLLPNTTPLRRRRRKNSDGVKNLPACVEDAASRDVAQDPSENRRVLPEEISVHTSQTMEERISSTPVPQFAPHFNRDVLVTDNQNTPRTRGNHERHEVVASGTGVEIVVKQEVQLSSPSRSEPVASSSAHDQGRIMVKQEVQLSSPSTSEPVTSSFAHDQDCQNMFNPGCSEPVLMSPIRRITANVDTMIRRATGMLEKFERWKIDNPNKDIFHGSGQMHLSFDKENLYQQGPCKNSKLRSLHGYTGGNVTQLDRKEGILKDLLLNAQT